MTAETQNILTKYNHPNQPSLLVLTGSHLYGVATPESDKDYRGFVLPTFDQMLGLEKFDQVELKDPDLVVYNYTKFIDLIVQASPNMAELLFAPKENILIADAVAQEILDNKEKFISRRWVTTFVGFSESSMQAYLNDKNKIKSAYHAMRILFYIRDILLDNKINFKDIETINWLKNIREEKVSHTDFINNYSALFGLVRDLEKKTTLPEQIDRDFVKKMKLNAYEIIIVDRGFGIPYYWK